MKLTKMAGFNALLAIAILVAACTPAAAPTPTLDPNMLYTSAAQTVIAQLTQNAPPPTPIPTNTLAPTSTPLAALPTIPPLGTLSPLKTSTQAISAGGDKCMYITQTPADGTSVKTGSSFNVTWRVRNTGTTTWDTTYYYRFYSAVNKIGTSQGGYDLTKSVPPGSDVDLTIQASVGSSAGSYDTAWVLTNPQGVNFCSFNVKVNAAAPSTADQPTAKPPAEAEVTTISEGEIDQGGGKLPDDHTWTLSNVTYTGGGTVRQARILFSVSPDVPADSILRASGNNGVEQQASQYATSAASGWMTLGVRSGDPYTFTFTKNADPDARVYRLEVCTSSVDCW